MRYRPSPVRLLCLLGCGLLAMPCVAFADTITVTIGGPGVSTIRIKDPNRPSNTISVYANYAGPPPSSPLIGSKTANSKGSASFSLVPPVVGASSLTVTVGTLFTEHFNIDPVSGSYQSLEEQQINANVLESLASLPFSGSDAMFASGTNNFTEFTLTNNSTQFSYDFTSLKLYTDLNMAYFNPSQFNSPAAIATGTLAQDFVAANGGDQTIPLAGTATPSDIGFSAPYSNHYAYELLVGTARPILGNGNFGAPQDFAIAAAAIPEPPSALLLAAGILCLGAAYRLRPRILPQGV